VGGLCQHAFDHFLPGNIHGGEMPYLHHGQ